MIIVMEETNNCKRVYERPFTEKVTVEVEGLLCASTTIYDNAGSAGNGEHKDNPFDEFGTTSATSASGTNADAFDSWSNY